MGLGTHQATGVHDDTETLSRQTEAVPVATLELTGLVRIEEEVASGGAAGERPSRTGLDDASSGHARGRSEKRADGPGRVLAGMAPMEGRRGGGMPIAASGRRLATTQRNRRALAPSGETSVGSSSTRGAARGRVTLPLRPCNTGAKGKLRPWVWGLGIGDEGFISAHDR